MSSVDVRERRGGATAKLGLEEGSQASSQGSSAPSKGKKRGSKARKGGKKRGGKSGGGKGKGKRSSKSGGDSKQATDGEGKDAAADAEEEELTATGVPVMKLRTAADGLACTVAEVPVKDAPADQLPAQPGHPFPMSVFPEKGFAAFVAGAGEALGGVDVARVYFNKRRVPNDEAFQQVMTRWKAEAADRQLMLFTGLVRHHWLGEPPPGGEDSPIAPLLGADILLRSQIAWEFATRACMAPAFNGQTISAIAHQISKVDDGTTEPVRRVCVATVGVLACGARSAKLCVTGRVLDVLVDAMEAMGPRALERPHDSVGVAGHDLLATASYADLFAVVVGGMASRRTGVNGVVTHEGFQLIRTLVNSGPIDTGPAATAIAAMCNCLGTPASGSRAADAPTALALFLAHDVTEVLLRVVTTSTRVRNLRCVASILSSLLGDPHATAADRQALGASFRRFADLVQKLWEWRAAVAFRIEYHSPEAVAARAARARARRQQSNAAAQLEAAGGGVGSVSGDGTGRGSHGKDNGSASGAGGDATASVRRSSAHGRDSTASLSSAAVAAAAIAAADEAEPPPEPTKAETRFLHGPQDRLFTRHVSYAFMRAMMVAPPQALEEWFSQPAAVAPVVDLLESPDEAVVTAALGSLASTCATPEVALHFCAAGVMPIVARILRDAPRTSAMFEAAMNLVCVAATKESKPVSVAMWEAGIFSVVVRCTRMLLREHGFKSLSTCTPGPGGSGSASPSGPGAEDVVVDSVDSVSRMAVVHANNKLKTPALLKYATSACMRLCQCHTPFDPEDVSAAVEVLSRTNVTMLPYTAMLVWAVAWDDRNKATVGRLGAIHHLGTWASFLYQAVDRPLFATRSSKLQPVNSVASLFSRKGGGNKGGPSRLLLAAAAANRHSTPSFKRGGRAAAAPASPKPQLEAKTANRLHQLVLGALWLLTYHPSNVTRLLRSGLVSMLATTHVKRYAEPDLLPSVHMCACTLWKACESAAVRVAVVDEGFVDHLFRLASNKNVPLRTRMVAGDFLQDLVGEVPENDGVRSEATAQLIDASGAQYPLMKLMLQFAVGADALSKRYGVAMLARTVDTQRAKRYFAQINATKTLLGELRHCARIEHTCDLLHCLLNVSSAPECQDQLGRYGMNLLLNLARNHRNNLVRDLAGRIMFNLGKHVANRTRLYKAELRYKARETRAAQVVAGEGRWTMVWYDGDDGDGPADGNRGLIEAVSEQEGAPLPANGGWVMRWESAARGDLSPTREHPSEMVYRRGSVVSMDMAHAPPLPLTRKHASRTPKGDSTRAMERLRASMGLPMSPIRTGSGGINDSEVSRWTEDAITESRPGLKPATLAQRMRASTASIWSGATRPVALATSAAEYELDHLTASGLWKSSKSPAKLGGSSNGGGGMGSTFATAHGSTMYNTSLGGSTRVERAVPSSPDPSRRAVYSEAAKGMIQQRRRGSVVERTYATDLKTLEVVPPPRTRQDPWLPPIARYNAPGMGRRRSVSFDPAVAAMAKSTRRAGGQLSGTEDSTMSPPSPPMSPVTRLNMSSDLAAVQEAAREDGAMSVRPGTPLSVILAPATDRHKISLRRRVAEDGGPKPADVVTQDLRPPSPQSPRRRGQPAQIRRMLSHPSVSVMKGGQDEASMLRAGSSAALVPKAVADAGVTTHGWYGRIGVNFGSKSGAKHGLASASVAMGKPSDAGGGGDSAVTGGVPGTGGSVVGAAYGGSKAVAGTGSGGGSDASATGATSPRVHRAPPGALAELKQLTVQQRMEHRHATSVKLFSFDHIDGCVVCEGMFEHFVMPDGQRKHYFAVDPLQHLVQDPVLVPPPPPTGLRRIFQSKYPTPPKPATSFAKRRPPAFNPTPPACFRPSKHALPTPPHDCSMNSCPLSASLPDRAIHFDVQRQIIIESSSSEEEIEPRFEWDITKSVFGPRKSHAECRAYFDHGTQAERRAFEIDWRRVYEKSRVQRLFQRESGGDEDAWRGVKKVLWRHFPILYDVFDYYATIGDGDCFSIQMNAWGDFTMQVGLVDVSPDCKAKDLQTIFIAANVEEDKTSAESKVNFARALHRFEFLECIIRVGLAAYHQEKTTEDMCAAIEKVIVVHLKERFDEHSQEAHNCDNFRVGRLYTEGVDLMYRPRVSHLKHLFDAFVGTRKASSTLATEMILARWLDMLDKLSLLDDDFSRREAILCFTWSKQLVPDELLHRERFISLGFYDFLEALGRAADWCSLPLDSDLEHLRCSDTFMFFEKLDAEEGEPFRRPSAMWDSPSERPLEEKLAKYLDLVMGRAQARGFLRNALAGMQESVTAYEPPARDTYCTLVNAEEVEASRKAVADKESRREERAEAAQRASDEADELVVEVMA